MAPMCGAENASLRCTQNKNTCPSDPPILTWTHIQTNHLKREMQPNVHSSPVYNSKTWKQPKSPLTDEWIKKI